MLPYIVNRILQGLLTTAVALSVIFFLVRLTGDPSLTLLPIDATNEQIKILRESLGLDRPVYEQLFLYFKNILSGDFGRSYATLRPISSELGMRLLNTGQLVLVATVFGILPALPLGVLAASKRGTLLEPFVKFIAFMGMSLPAFWVGILLIIVFAQTLHWLPAGGMSGLKSLLLPGFTLSLIMLAGVVRLLRSSMLDTLDTEYIKLAYSKGVSRRDIIWKHALRNALIPVVTFAAMWIAIFMTGTIVVETVFSWPGLGRWVYQGLLQRDFPVVQAVIIVLLMITIAINLLVDILYSYLDPRIRLN